MSEGRRVKFNVETAHCGPCSTREDKASDATAYCKTCQQFLCRDCLKPHRKLVAMENHVLLNRDHEINEELVLHFDNDVIEDVKLISKVPEEIESTFREYEEYRRRTMHEIEQRKANLEIALDDKPEEHTPEYEFYEHCDEHPEEKLKFFCILHQHLCCDKCKTTKHQVCLSNVKYIPEHIQDVDKKEDMMNKFKQHIHSLKDFDKSLQSDMKELRKSRHTFLYDLKVKKREILNWMNLMEVRAIRRVEIVFDKCKRELDRKRQNTKKACQKLRTEMYFLKEILHNEQHDDVYKYVKEKKADKLMKEVAKSRENRKNTMSRFYLKVDSEFESAKATINYLYELKFETRGEDKFSVRLKDDKHVSNVTGCTTLYSGEMVLADSNNCKLKHVDNNCKPISNTVVPDDVFDVTAIGFNAVAFTSPRKSTIHIAEVRPSLDIVKTVNTGEGMCWGLSHHKGTFVVSVSINDRSSIKVVDLDSNVLFQAETKLHFYPALIMDPIYSELNAVAVTSYKDGQEATLEHYIDKYRDPDNDKSNISVSVYNYLSHLHVKGICLDKHGNVIACCQDTDQVYAISKTGDEAELLLAESDGLCRPQAICYASDGSTLLVASEQTDYVQIFRFESERDQPIQ